MAIIVTNCSKRKRVRPLPRLRAESLPKGDLEVVVSEWAARVRSATSLVEAGFLYCGRQFFQAFNAAEALQAELLVVSAGLGVVRAKDRVPAYSLTAARSGVDSVLNIVEPHVSAQSWWRSLLALSEGFSSLQSALILAGPAAGPILIAMPSSYLMMVESELEQFSPDERSRTRIFTSSSFRFREESLNDLIMPYDNRLDGPGSPCPGTATDFSARAMAHFASYIFPQHTNGSHRQHAELVTQHLAHWQTAVRPVRTRMSDEKLLHLIRANWAVAGSSASEMLRFVRHDLGLACEQGRMRELHAVVRAEMGVVV